MSKIKIGIFLCLSFILVFSSCKEQKENSKVCINEVMIDNEDSYQDNFGSHTAWIEIFNKSFASVNVESYKIVVETEGVGKTTYVIPKGDVNTIIKPRQHVIFWADGEASKGTFYTNITLHNDKDTKIGLYDLGDKKFDEVLIKANTLSVNQSYGRVNDASEQWEVKDGIEGRHITPSTNNKANVGNSKMVKFQQEDSLGVGMSITAMSVVFSSLFMLFISFFFIGKLAIYFSNRNNRKSESKQAINEKQTTATSSPSDEDVYVAIAMALYQYTDEAHDEETMLLTFDTERQNKSAWNSKAATLREIPYRK